MGKQVVGNPSERNMWNKRTRNILGEEADKLISKIVDFIKEETSYGK